jgi:hypothetical protein
MTGDESQAFVVFCRYDVAVRGLTYGEAGLARPSPHRLTGGR